MSDANQFIRVLGIDPGLNITGYGVIDFFQNQQIRVVEAGVVRGGNSKKPMGTRLLNLKTGLTDVIDSLKPQVVALEELYSHYDRPRTAILMGHARGVLTLVAAEANLTVHSYAATQIKRVLTGNGRAPKSQMQQAIAMQLQLEDLPEPPDVADALAIAVCHCFLNVRSGAFIH